MNKLSYCLIGDPHAVSGLKDPGNLVLSGLWQWSLAFNEHGKTGDVRMIRRKEDLEEFDIIHINMTSGNLALPQMVKDELKDSDTKLIVNVDFDVMQWGANWQYPTLLTKAIECADMVFHVESTGADILEHVLGRDVHTLPHPVDVLGINQYKKTEREPTIVTMWHRYIPDCTLPYFAQKDIDMYRVLLGHKSHVPTHAMYDFVYKPRGFIDTIETMSSATFGCDLYPGRTYGRAVAEFAALAVPCVCSNTIEAARRCFPSLTVDPFDIKGAHDLFQQLIDDENLMVDAYKYAFDAAGYYSQKNCYNRMVELLDGGNVVDDPPEQWEDIQMRYARRSNRTRPPEYLDAISKVSEKFREFVGLQGTILDVGCGNGKFAGTPYAGSSHEYLSDKNTIIGLDPLPQFETRFPVVNGKGESIPFQAGVFDAVTIVSVLDHVMDPISVLREGARVLKNSGKLFIWCPVFQTTTHKHHLHTYSEESLTKLVLSLGFTITKEVVYGNEPGYMFIEAVNPRYSTDYWKKASTVDDHKKFWDHSEYKDAQEARTIQILHDRCDGVSSVLDAGAGICRMYKSVADAGYDYSAVDLSDTMLSECPHNIDSRVGKLTDIPFENRQFDSVICLHVIRHNDPDNYASIIDELCRVSDKYVLILNPFVDTPNQVHQMFKREVWDLPMRLLDLDAMMDSNNFHQVFSERCDGDMKHMDYFALYRRS